MDYASKKCVPCTAGTPPLGADAVDAALRQVTGWEARENRTRIHKQFRFKDFVEAMKFVNALADVAEAEGHHPDFTVHYNQVDVTIWTHKVGGLSENDFILAAKIDKVRDAKTR